MPPWDRGGNEKENKLSFIPYSNEIQVKFVEDLGFKILVVKSTLYIL